MVHVIHASTRRRRGNRSRRNGQPQGQPSLAKKSIRMYGGCHPSNPSSTTSTTPPSLTTTHVTPTSPSYARRTKHSNLTSTLKPGRLLNTMSRSSDYGLIEGGNTLIRISRLTSKPKELNGVLPRTIPLSIMALLKPSTAGFLSAFVLCSTKVVFPSSCGGRLYCMQIG